MKPTLLMIAAALSLAACDRAPDNRAAQTPPASSSAAAGSSAPAQSNTPTTPANIGQPGSHEEKKDGANPIQQQVDPKEAQQHRDFQRRGDGAGPRGPDTEPKTGG